MRGLSPDPWAIFNWLWIIIFAGGPLVLALGVFQAVVKLTNTGKRLETNLNTAYLEAQNYLSHSIMLIRETLQINLREAETLERALAEAITGRYKNAASKDAVFNILHESYPDMSAFSASFSRIDAAVQNSRAAFAQMQSKLLQELNAFEQWRTGTFLSRILMKNNFPDGDLVARIGTARYTGKQALEKMYQIIQTGEGLAAYHQGTHEPMQLY
ncbi:MAG: hypothetical protein LBH54_00875 [Clostridiales bacterium]|jgi:hypothetical protein|nr:hypothetical protein [Clostridiales bacterium]